MAPGSRSQPTPSVRSSMVDRGVDVEDVDVAGGAPRRCALRCEALARAVVKHWFSWARTRALGGGEGQPARQPAPHVEPAQVGREAVSGQEPGQRPGQGSPCPHASG